MLKYTFPMLALIACGDSGTTSTGDSTTTTTAPTTTTTDPGATTFTGPTTITSVNVSCDGTTWNWDSTTEGWTDGISNLGNAWETGSSPGWNDEHTLPAIDFDPLKYWEVQQRSLASGAASPEMDVSTLFACGVHDVDPTMTFSVRVYDEAGALADCWVWGEDVAGVIDGSNRPNLNGDPTSPYELAGCTDANLF